MSTVLLSILVLYLLTRCFSLFLEYLNLKSLRREAGLPPGFEALDPAHLEKSREYAAENIKFSMAATVWREAIIVAFIFGGVLEWYSRWVEGLGLGFIPSGVVFFMLLQYAGVILNAPVSLYRTFVIEKRHGFSNMTPALWAVDLAKGLVLSTVVYGVLIVASLWIISASPGLWWLWLWAFFLAFSVFLMYLSPYVIEPFFNKFSPLEDRDLAEEVKDLMKKAGVTVERVFRVDASRRSTHTNAYFSGLGRVKRIVLFDTLLEKLDRGEVLSVLAHEAGHWKKGHIIKRILLTEAIALGVFYASFRALEAGFLNGLFGLAAGSFFTEVVLLALLWSMAAFPITPLASALSRKHEREADLFAVGLTRRPSEMASALVKLARDNLANLHPHPLYVLFNYSHPPLKERVKRLEELPGGGPGAS